ncbi:MAG: hypothetical protein WBQ18_20610 [Solirubrobacteraceae bacterium]
MLLKHRPPGIDSSALPLREGLEHLEPNSIAVLRWLVANKVDFVLVGAVARALRGDTATRGPVAIVPAPYGRNYERLTRALVAEHAALRSERGLDGHDRGDAVTVKLTTDKLARGRRWLLRFGDYDLDLESAGRHGGDDAGRGPRYQELLYEANRYELADGLAVEVASHEDLEHFSHVRRTGSAPEFRVSRNAAPGPAAAAPAQAPAEAPTAPDGAAEARSTPPEVPGAPDAPAEADARTVPGSPPDASGH